MTKEQRVEKMAKVLFDTNHADLCNDCIKERSCEKKFRCVEPCFCYSLASDLQNAGYGNLREFAEKLKKRIHEDNFEQLCQDGATSEEMVFDYIDEILKEQGVDSKCTTK